MGSWLVFVKWVHHLQHLIQQNRQIAALLEIGNMSAFDAAVDEYRSLASDTGLPQYLWYPTSYDSMRAAMQEKGAVDRAFGVRSWPTNYVIDPEGRVVFATGGWDEARLRALLRAD